MIRVLIVDDQQLLLDLMKHMLDNHNEVEVVGCAFDGNEAARLAEKLKPDVILMDIIMPGCSGIEATKKIKLINSDVKILVLTTSNSEEDVHEALNNGADGYILKSIKEDELILAIKGIYANMEVVHRDVREVAKNSKLNAINKVANKTRIRVNDIDVELSDREIEIMRMIVDGVSTGDMATNLFVSEGRLRNMITELISKLMLKDRTGLAVFALKNKLV